MIQTMTNNALTAIRLGKFKAFAELQRVPIRPLTFIYGPNSAGKSSIIHSLLLASHGIETGELDVYRTNIGGEAVDLGGFGQYVYKHDRRQCVEWAVELDRKHLQVSEPLSHILKSVHLLTVGITIGTGFTSDQLTLFGDFDREIDKNQQVRVESFSLEADGQKVLIMSLRQDGILRLDSLDYTHPLIKHFFDAIPLTIPPESEPLIKQVIYDLVPNITAKVSCLLPEGILVNGKLVEIVSDYSSLLSEQPLAEQIRFSLPHLLQDLIRGIKEGVEREMIRLRYLGPFRSYPPRHFASNRQQDANWNAGGGRAWDTLLSNPLILQKVNDWLGDNKMKTHYQFAVRNLLPSSQIASNLPRLLEKGYHDLTAKLMLYVSGFGNNIQQELERLTTELESEWGDIDTGFSNVDNIIVEIRELVSTLTDVDEDSEKWSEEITESSTEQFPDLVLLDTRIQIPVSHRDVGIGISQIIPILVYCYSFSNALIAIEQPEIHLHPKLQAELGDVLIESALGANKNTLIVETHSENLLLRIMRRMRETFNEELPNGTPRVTPEDISVLYIEPLGKQSIVREIPLNECGELLELWPEGFFEERLKEIFP
jgi:hypothetical protein